MYIFIYFFSFSRPSFPISSRIPLSSPFRFFSSSPFNFFSFETHRLLPPKSFKICHLKSSLIRHISFQISYSVSSIPRRPSPISFTLPFLHLSYRPKDSSSSSYFILQIFFSLILSQFTSSTFCSPVGFKSSPFHESCLISCL